MRDTSTAKRTDYLDEILQVQAANEPIRCPVGRFLADPNVEERVREGIRQALDTPKIYATTIAEIIGAGDKPVRLHRRGQCSCSRRGL